MESEFIDKQQHWKQNACLLTFLYEKLFPSVSHAATFSCMERCMTAVRCSTNGKRKDGGLKTMTKLWNFTTCRGLIIKVFLSLLLQSLKMRWDVLNLSLAVSITKILSCSSAFTLFHGLSFPTELQGGQPGNTTTGQGASASFFTETNIGGRSAGLLFIWFSWAPF